jgi:hypothetical protein
LPWIEWVRARDFGEQKTSGNPFDSSTGGIQVGIGGIKPSPYGSGLAASTIE